MHRNRALTVHRPQTISAGVAAADYHHMLALGGDFVIGGYRIALASAVLLGQILHGKVHAGQLAPRNRQVT